MRSRSRAISGVTAGGRVYEGTAGPEGGPHGMGLYAPDEAVVGNGAASEENLIRVPHRLQNTASGGLGFPQRMQNALGVAVGSDAPNSAGLPH